MFRKPTDHQQKGKKLFGPQDRFGLKSIRLSIYSSPQAMISYGSGVLLVRIIGALQWHPLIMAFAVIGIESHARGGKP
jgi:hypothetical protein